VGDRCPQNIPNKGVASKILQKEELASTLVEAALFSPLFAALFPTI
jgi:hypothetical protein